MIYRQFLGIYINESIVQCASYYKFLPGLLPGKKGFIKKKLFSHETLKKVLDELKPSRKRKIYIGLPRNVFFTRRIVFPDLPLDDVRDAVVNSLETYAHLPVEEMYYDILFTKINGDGVNALLYYAPRKKLDPLYHQLRESGHIFSLDGIFPFSYGAGPWYAKTTDTNTDEKFGLVVQYPNALELAIYYNKSCVDSILLDAFVEKQELNQVIQEIAADHGIESEQITWVSDPDSVDDFSAHGNRGDENMGCAALAPVIHGMQLVNVDETPPRIKLFKPMKVLLPLFSLLAAFSVYMSMVVQNEIRDRQAALASVKQQIIEINTEIDPILEAKQALQQAAEYKEDVEDFISTKPPLFSYINDLAEIVPENTWFAHLSYKPGIISMQGQGDDVLKVVEALRASGKYKEVKLQGSVSRTQQGKDNFRIDLILKESDNTIKGTEK